MINIFFFSLKKLCPCQVVNLIQYLTSRANITRRFSYALMQMLSPLAAFNRSRYYKSLINPDATTLSVLYPSGVFSII